VALSVGRPYGTAPRVYPFARSCVGDEGYAASRPLVFGLSSLPNFSGRAILRPSKIRIIVNRIWAFIKEALT
jgi:hypothetical protein